MDGSPRRRSRTVGGVPSGNLRGAAVSEERRAFVARPRLAMLLPARRTRDPLDGEPDAVALERRRLLARLASVGLALFAVTFGVTHHASAIGSLLRREMDVFGEPIYVPPHPSSRAALASIDFERVHSRLLPAFVVALAHADTANGRARAEFAFRELRASLSPDENLVELWREIGLLARIGLERNARRIDYLLWAYDHYLDSLGIPYRVEATMFLLGDRPRLAVRCYLVLSDARAERGERVRYVQRVDGFGDHEPWLGRTAREEDGAVVLAERVLHFATRHIWPGLHPALDARRPADERGSLAAVRAEASRAIDPELLAILVETAEDQQALLETAASIEARHACGSTFEVYDIPYRGLSARSYRMLELAVERGRDSACPDVTLAEAAQIVGAAERLAATPRLEDALEALAAFTARAVAAHELRHVADGPSAELDCAGFEDASPLVRAEASAYLASFADPSVGHTARLVACSNPEREQGIDAAAIRLALRDAAPEGCAAPAEDLHARARAALTRRFGARAAVLVPEGFPENPRFLVRRAPVVADTSWLVDDEERSAGADASPERAVGDGATAGARE